MIESSACIGVSSRERESLFLLIFFVFVSFFKEGGGGSVGKEKKKKKRGEGGGGAVKCDLQGNILTALLLFLRSLFSLFARA